MAIMPMVAAVATLEPDTAAKIAQEKMLATASPPGRKPTQRATAVNSPLPMAERGLPLAAERANHAERHEQEAGGDQEHGHPERVEHDGRDAAVAKGRQRRLRGDPDHDGEEDDPDDQIHDPEPRARGGAQVGR